MVAGPVSVGGAQGPEEAQDGREGGRDSVSDRGTDGEAPGVRGCSDRGPGMASSSRGAQRSDSAEAAWLTQCLGLSSEET